MRFDQADYDVRCEWGAEGIARLSPGVDVAVSRGAAIYPYRWRDERAVAYAESLGAVLANPRRSGEGFSLSPASLVSIPAGTRLVLPSPNGSALTLAVEGRPVFAGCLRNARAVAAAARRVGKRIAVIPAGERWEDGTLRFAVEDLVGAGAVIHNLEGTRSPEALAAEAAFLRFRDDLSSLLRECNSGREIIERGYVRDVELAAQLDMSDCAPRLVDGAYVRDPEDEGDD